MQTLVFYTRRSDRGVTVVALYVDDLIIAGSNDTVISEVKKTLKKKYKMKDLGLLDWILGMEVVQDPAAKMIRLNQTKYIQDLLVKFNIHECNVSTPMDDRDRLSKCDRLTSEGDELYMKTIPNREAVSSLLWLSIGTRPDVSFAVNQVVHYMETPGVKH